MDYRGTCTVTARNPLLQGAVLEDKVLRSMGIEGSYVLKKWHRWRKMRRVRSGEWDLFAFWYKHFRNKLTELKLPNVFTTWC